MNNLKALIKYYAKLFIRGLIKIFVIFPINDKRVFFSSFLGQQVSDNPKYIYDYLRTTSQSNFEYIWVYNGDNSNLNISKDCKVVKRFSIRWLYYIRTSKVIVDNIRPTFIIPPRKGQLYIQTWHAGGAYKRIGSAALKNDFEQTATEKAMSIVNLFVSSSKIFTETNIEDGYHFKGEIINCGMPRNDIFFNDKLVEKKALEVKHQFSLGEIVVLYAPTFRGHVNNADAMSSLIDIKQLKKVLEMKYGVNASILVRCHYFDKHNYEFDEDIINVSDYPDMQNLLCASDILITDYSSCMWDFALLGRPCLLYTPDLDDYINERGFFTPIENWPGIMCRNMEELCDNILNLDKGKCFEQAKKHLDMMGSFENGHATESICDRIINYIEGN